MIPVRLAEWERYDIERDEEVVRFMAITGNGTYHAEVSCETPRRDARERFKELVVECIERGISPCQLEIDGGSGRNGPGT